MAVPERRSATVLPAHETEFASTGNRRVAHDLVEVGKGPVEHVGHVGPHGAGSLPASPGGAGAVESSPLA